MIARHEPQSEAFAPTLCDALTKATGKPITVEMYLDWLDGGDQFQAFETIAREYLTEETAIRLESVARVHDGLCYKLGVGPSVSGGINLSKIIK